MTFLLAGHCQSCAVIWTLIRHIQLMSFCQFTWEQPSFISRIAHLDGAHLYSGELKTGGKALSGVQIILFLSSGSSARNSAGCLRYLKQFSFKTYLKIRLFILFYRSTLGSRFSVIFSSGLSLMFYHIYMYCKYDDQGKKHYKSEKECSEH